MPPSSADRHPVHWQFNPPPGWPPPPPGWSPPPGWRAPSSWPAAPRGWQFWIESSLGGNGSSGSRQGLSTSGWTARTGQWITRHWILSITGLLVALMLVLALVPSGRTGSAAESPGSAQGVATASPTSSSTPSFPADPLGLGFPPQRGQVGTATGGLTKADLDRASAFGEWLTDWAEHDFGGRTTDHAKQVQKLADDYQDLGVASKKTGKLIDEAAGLVKKGQKSTRAGAYDSALRHYASAAAKLKSASRALSADVTRAELSTGARLQPRFTGSGGSPEHLFPVASSTSAVSVVRWIDGDTVDTSAGRVRLIGIDTPEMSKDCDQARAAKAYAEHLAPPGSTVNLGDPASVINKDTYGRLLRYVDLAEVEPSAPGMRVDVGASLLLSSLAEARYDSRDGYQWHPRERTYRAASGELVGNTGCSAPTEKGAFVLAVALADSKGSPEYWRDRLLSTSLSAPVAAAKKSLPQHVRKTRAIETAKEERQRAKQLERQRAAQRERAAEAEAERQRAAERERIAQEERAAKEESDEEDTSGSGGGNGGYTGPRCYAPGGKTWKPC